VSSLIKGGKTAQSQYLPADADREKEIEREVGQLFSFQSWQTTSPLFFYCCSHTLLLPPSPSLSPSLLPFQLLDEAERLLAERLEQQRLHKLLLAAQQRAEKEKEEKEEEEEEERNRMSEDQGLFSHPFSSLKIVTNSSQPSLVFTDFPLPSPHFYALREQ
jgi:signal transduction histidine kinase